MSDGWVYAQTLGKTYQLDERCSHRVTISAEKDGLEFIIRALLDNAADHGLKESSVIKVKEQADAKSWILLVVNAGQMTADEDRTKFDACTRLPNARNVRSHIALAASLRWAEAHGARLTVDNSTDGDRPCVVAKLVWPLA